MSPLPSPEQSVCIKQTGHCGHPPQLIVGSPGLGDFERQGMISMRAGYTTKSQSGSRVFKKVLSKVFLATYGMLCDSDYVWQRGVFGFEFG